MDYDTFYYDRQCNVPNFTVYRDFGIGICERITEFPCPLERRAIFYQYLPQIRKDLDGSSDVYIVRYMLLSDSIYISADRFFYFIGSLNPEPTVD